VVAVIAIVGIGVRNEFAVGSGGFERHQAIAVGHAGQRVQQNHLDPTEDGGVGGDADGQREHGDQREAGALAQHAQTIANVL
jgi:hypothetical protein